MASTSQSISQLISEFRVLNAKDSISPESLGYLLQLILDRIPEDIDPQIFSEINANIAEIRALANDALSKYSQANQNINSLIQVSEGMAGRLDSAEAELRSLSSLRSTCDKLAERLSTAEGKIDGISELSVELSDISSRVTELSNALSSANAELIALKDSRGKAGGLATLGSDGKLSVSQLPESIDFSTFDGFVEQIANPSTSGIYFSTSVKTFVRITRIYTSDPELSEGVIHVGSKWYKYAALDLSSLYDTTIFRSGNQLYRWNGDSLIPVGIEQIELDNLHSADQLIEANLNNAINRIESLEGRLRVAVMSQAEYDALAKKEGDSTIYFITED